MKETEKEAKKMIHEKNNEKLSKFFREYLGTKTKKVIVKTDEKLEKVEQ